MPLKGGPARGHRSSVAKGARGIILFLRLACSVQSRFGGRLGCRKFSGAESLSLQAHPPWIQGGCSCNDRSRFDILVGRDG